MDDLVIVIDALVASWCARYPILHRWGGGGGVRGVVMFMLAVGGGCVCCRRGGIQG
jgi:hypothetical protein